MGHYSSCTALFGPQMQYIWQADKADVKGAFHVKATLTAADTLWRSFACLSCARTSIAKATWNIEGRDGATSIDLRQPHPQSEKQVVA